MNRSPIGILGAMDEEVRRLRESIGSTRHESAGKRPYHFGEIAGHPVVLAFSRARARVAAASVPALAAGLLIIPAGWSVYEAGHQSMNSTLPL